MSDSFTGREAKLKEKKRKAEEAADAPPPKKKITPAKNTPEKNLLRKSNLEGYLVRLFK